ncbi:MAG: alpha/beta hydrolase [Fastidiosipilaceae bacterium]
MKSQNVILCVHGFMGSPRQFDDLLAALDDQSWDVRNLLLPGHSAGVREFATSGPAVWISAVEDCLEELRRSYENIVIWTHSMGGMLAIIAAAKNSARIRRIVAIALPIRLRLSFTGIRINLSALLGKKQSKDPRVVAAVELRGVGDVTWLNAARLLPNVKRLRIDLVRRTTETVTDLDVPLTVVNSMADETVPHSATKVIRRLRPDARVMILQQSSHFWFTEEEKRVLVGAMDDAMLEVGQSSRES